MPFGLKKGALHLALLGLALFVAFSVALAKFRPYLYMALQHSSFAVGINLNDIASSKYIEFIKSQNGQKQNNFSGVFLNQTFNYEETNTQQASVLGDSAGSNKKIEIDLSEQKLYMKEEDNTIGTFLVSTGKWAPTPTGNYAIWIKLRYTRMTGGSKALNTYYDLPNVPYVMYFYQGYGIHGAYWHNNFGQPMSHGCVNMRPEEAGIVFNWASVGTPVIVYN